MQRSRPHNAVMYGQPLDKTHLQAERSGCEKEGGDDGQIAGQCAPVMGAEAERGEGGAVGSLQRCTRDRRGSNVLLVAAAADERRSWGVCREGGSPPPQQVISLSGGSARCKRYTTSLQGTVPPQ